MIILGKVLGPALFGVYALGWTILRMLGFFATFGSDRGMVRYGSLYWDDDPAALKGALIQTLVTAALGSGLMAAVLYFIAPYLALEVFDEPRLEMVLRWFALGLLLFTAMRVVAAATRASQRMQYSVAAQDLGQPAANLFLVAVFFVLGMRLGGAVAAAVISFAVALSMALLFLHRLVPELYSMRLKPSFAGKELLLFSLPASLAGMFGAYMVWVDRLILGHFRPSADVGIYQAVSQFSIIFAIVLAAIGNACAPMIARFHKAQDTDRLQELYRVSTKWGLYLSLPAFLVICMAPVELLTVLFTSEYEAGWLALIILASGQLIAVATGSVNALLVMTGRPNLWLMLSAPALALNILLNVLFIPRWGVTGAAAATATALATLFIAGVIQVRRALGVWPYDRRLLKAVLAVVVVTAALLALKAVTSALTIPAGVALLLTVLVATLAFGGTLLAVGYDDEDRALLEAIQARLRS
jgi:O-antigen/teichoic acid export membrane protein